MTTYIFWIHHEEIEGQFDWTGQRDLRHFVELCAKHGMYLVGCLYNFCTPHQSLRTDLHRTPAMAAGLTDHCWSVGELLSYRFAPPPFVLKKRRGRPPKSEAQLQEEGKQLVTG